MPLSAAGMIHFLKAFGRIALKKTNICGKPFSTQPARYFMIRTLFAWLALSVAMGPASADTSRHAMLSYHGRWAVMMTRDSSDRFSCVAYTANQAKDILAFTLEETGVMEMDVTFGTPLAGFGPDQSIESRLVLVLDRQRFVLEGAMVSGAHIAYRFVDRDDALELLGKLVRTEFATMFDASGSGIPLAAWSTGGANDAIGSQARCYNRIYTG